MKILVASENPVKIEAVEKAFSNYFEDLSVVGIKTESNVPHQPINSETFVGAQNRAQKLFDLNTEKKLGADFFVGIEGGIELKHERWFAFGCMCVIDSYGNKSFGTSPHFELPENVTKRLLDREELGDVMDDIMKLENTKQKMGAIGFFTNGVMDRKELYVPGIIAALVPFNHPKMYFTKD